MKKLLLFTFLLMLIGRSYSIPIISVTKQCGGLFGYDYVHWERQIMEVNDNGTNRYGWAGECEGRGLRRCKPPASQIVLNETTDANEADVYDQGIAEGMIESAEGSISTSGQNGSQIQTYLVSGQTFYRVYTLTWSSVPTVCYDDNGNQIASFIAAYSCSVQYVSI